MTIGTFGGLAVRPLPQGAKGARAADDGVVMNLVLGGDLAELIRHPRAAGNAVDETTGPFEDAVENALRPAHLPQDVDVDGAKAAPQLRRRHVIRALDLLDCPFDGITDKLLVALAAAERGIDLRNDSPGRVIAVGVDRADRTDAARQRPRARRQMVGRGDAFATLDERQDVAPTHHHRVQTVEHRPPL